MYEKPIARYLKWAVSLMIPTGMMYFLFDSTNMSPILIFALAIGLCAGFLFLFKLIVIPGSVEASLSNENDLINLTNKLLSSLETEATKTKREELIELVEEFVKRGQALNNSMLNDQIVTLAIPNSINGQLSGIVASVTECNKLLQEAGDLVRDEVADRLKTIESKTLPKLYVILGTIYKEYLAGRILAIDIKLRQSSNLSELFDPTITDLEIQISTPTKGDKTNE